MTRRTAVCSGFRSHHGPPGEMIRAVSAEFTPGARAGTRLRPGTSSPRILAERAALRCAARRGAPTSSASTPSARPTTAGGRGCSLRARPRRSRRGRAARGTTAGEYGGWPVRFGWDDAPVTKHVEVADVRTRGSRSGSASIPRPALTTRRLAGCAAAGAARLTGRRVFDDGARASSSRCATQLAWYPDDVWLWLLACQWRRIDQEEPFVGRTAEVGDELGSRVIAARLVRDADAALLPARTALRAVQQVARHRLPAARRLRGRSGRPLARRAGRR